MYGIISALVYADNGFGPVVVVVTGGVVTGGVVTGGVVTGAVGNVKEAISAGIWLAGTPCCAANVWN
jgi:hypothetical protein